MLPPPLPHFNIGLIRPGEGSFFRSVKSIRTRVIFTSGKLFEDILGANCWYGRYGTTTADSGSLHGCVVMAILENTARARVEVRNCKHLTTTMKRLKLIFKTCETVSIRHNPQKNMPLGACHTGHCLGIDVVIFGTLRPSADLPEIRRKRYLSRWFILFARRSCALLPALQVEVKRE